MFNRDYKKTADEITSFIQKILKMTGFNKVVIGLSGGIDSGTVCYLLVKALGGENVFPVILPHHTLQMHHKDDARYVVERLEIPKKNVYEIDIKKAVDDIASHDMNIDQTRKGNIMSRTRMIYLYDIAKKHKALVAGTENKTEYLLGYFTRFGDEASDFEPIRHLYKTEVFRLAQLHLGVPEALLVKSPTAGLWEKQTDEEEFGFSYHDADQILYLSFDQKKTKQEIIRNGFESHVVEKVLQKVTRNSFKHVTPYILNSLQLKNKKG